MALDEERSRWRVWLAQAERFAETDNHVDALARVRSIVAEVNELADARSDDEFVQREKVFFDKQLARFEQRYANWHQQVVSRSKAFDDREREVYKAEKPGGRLT